MEEIRRAVDRAGQLSHGAQRIKKRPRGKTLSRKETPREVFLPAIDPLPYVAAQPGPRTERTASEAAPAAASHPEPRPSVEFLPGKGSPVAAKARPLPADALPELLWPPHFNTVRDVFLRCRPSGRFRLPGWRFVRASAQEEGLWLGRQAAEGRVIRIAYIYPGPPEAGSEYQPLAGTDGKPYRALVQRA